MPRVRREVVDADYLDQLSPEDLAWYHQFISESVQASIPKTKDGKLHPKRLHKSKEEIKEVYSANNRRNNDLYGVTKANGLLYDMGALREDMQFHNAELWEEAMIALIDHKDIIADENFYEMLEGFEDLLLEEIKECNDESDDSSN